MPGPDILLPHAFCAPGPSGAPVQPQQQYSAPGGYGATQQQPQYTQPQFAPLPMHMTAPGKSQPFLIVFTCCVLSFSRRTRDTIPMLCLYILSLFPFSFLFQCTRCNLKYIVEPPFPIASLHNGSSNRWTSLGPRMNGSRAVLEVLSGQGHCLSVYMPRLAPYRLAQPPIWLLAALPA